jgi:hypothetical protein
MCAEWILYTPSAEKASRGFPTNARARRVRYEVKLGGTDAHYFAELMHGEARRGNYSAELKSPGIEWCVRALIFQTASAQPIYHAICAMHLAAVATVYVVF